MGHHRRWAGIVTAALLWASASHLAQPGAMTIPVDLAGKRGPVWGGNAIVVAEGPIQEPLAFTAYDRTGKVVGQGVLRIPDATQVSVRSFGRGDDGSIAVSGVADDLGFLAWLSGDGVSQRVIRTGPYRANLLAIAPDGTVWTAGSGLSGDALRHFDSSGKVLETFVPQSSLPNVSLTASTNGFLTVGGGRVGWFSCMPQGEGLYAEVAADGSLARYPIPSLPSRSTYLESHGIAITAEGDVYAAMMFVAIDGQQVNKSYAVLRLDREARQWSPSVTAIASNWAWLFGAAGSDLVVSALGDSSSVVEFTPAGH